MSEKIVFRPIGYVSNAATTDMRPEELRKLTSEIIIDLAYLDGLMDIEVNELITVIFYFNGVRDYSLLLHPRGDINRPITGVFNTRSQFRPNPIGVTVAKLKSREDNKLIVEGLDALDGTPVLDIKPHVLTFDEGIDDPGQDRTYRSLRKEHAR